MTLRRRTGNRFEANIWPGFVDAMTALLLVLMFVLTIFMIVQFVLRDTITDQEGMISDQELQLDNLSGQVAELADALGLEQQRTDRLETDVGALESDLSDAEREAREQSALIATLTDQRDTAQTRIATFEEQVASLLTRNSDLISDLSRTAEELEAERAQTGRLMNEAEALDLALARARTEIDANTEAARLAAARREALTALVEDLQSDKAQLEADVAAEAEALSDAEAARVAEAAAAQALRERLRNADAELTAMTLSLEAERQRAEDTLTLLAAARAARDELAAESSANLSEAERRAALLAQANALLSQERALSAESQRKVEVLSQQTAALGRQLDALQGVLDEAQARDTAAKIQIEALGNNLNTALAQVADEQRRRADLEEAERRRLEAEAKNLENYRSEFFGRVREILGDREGVRIVGDRFVFSSEVLFERGSAELGPGGRQQLAQVAGVIREIRDEIPDQINWILRVDGHTDDIPITSGPYSDNWELSQARALSVVKYLIDTQDIPPDRLSANGFGEFQPVDSSDTAEARARNRRIELKFTER